jgi:diguanylate cyclase (GGDEF)-like protein
MQDLVLVVGGKSARLADLCALLSREGQRSEVSHDPAEAIARASEADIGAVLLMGDLPGDAGMEILRSVRSSTQRRYVPVMMLGGSGDRERRLAALKLGADDVLEESVDPDELLARLQRSLGVTSRFDSLLRQSEHLHELSVTDGLTRIYNHRFFQERLRDEFRRAQRYDDPLSLIILDVDHFKDVNDRFGHAVGDQVLSDVATAIKSAVRDTDLLARYGGEEFAVLLPRTHLSGALTVAERMTRALVEMSSGPGGAVKITASIGVSGFPGRSVLTSEQLVRTADEALYRAKSEGRNKICLYQQVSWFSGQPVRAS